MERVTNYLRGSVRIRVRCRYPERFINICAKSGAEFWDMEREGEDLVLTTHRRDYRFLRRRALMGDYDVTEAKTAGTVFFLRRFRRRYALLAGMLLTLCALWYASLFIWEIGVTGNETVPSAEILRELKELGVGVGTLRLTLDQDRISNEMLLRIPELCWLTVNTNGCRAEVKVREEIPKPEMVDEYVPTEVYAKKTGIIEKMTVLEGKKLVMPGDTVMAGDILVTGAMDSLSTGTRHVHAMGEIYARTLYSVSAAAPSAVNMKEYTGREKTKHALVIGGSRLNLYLSGGVSWEHYDKTAETRKLEFFGFVLPVGFVRDTYREYELSVTEAEDIPDAVKERMLRDLAEKIDGEVRKTEFSVDERDGRITVTMTAE
ncbi:MAG: sporulation protein YqfD, partial [Oscillospiraceae bacterium]|nr:sporulation protein YqfD [Oscillospiraceae bacterium]